jgi:thiol-disulfide isomerase/thioredoxin
MAAWCGLCRRFAPVFDEASERHPDVVFAKVDTEAEQNLASALRIQSIPTLMVLRPAGAAAGRRELVGDRASRSSTAR